MTAAPDLVDLLVAGAQDRFDLVRRQSASWLLERSPAGERVPGNLKIVCEYAASIALAPQEQRPQNIEGDGMRAPRCTRCRCLLQPEHIAVERRGIEILGGKDLTIVDDEASKTAGWRADRGRNADRPCPTHP